MRELPNIFIIEDGVTSTSIALAWKISGDTPRTVRVSRMSPTEKLLAQLTSEQVAATNTLHDTELAPETLYSYTVICEYDDSIELSNTVTAHTAPFPLDQIVLPRLTVRTSPPGFACRRDGAVNVTLQWDNDAHAAWVKLVRDTSTPPITDRSVPPTHMFGYDVVNQSSQHTYHITNWQGPGRSGVNTTVTINVKAPQCPLSEFFPVNSGLLIVGNGFELLVPQGDLVSHYVDSAQTITEGIWQQVDVLKVPKEIMVQDTAVFLVQNHSVLQERLDAIVWVKSTQGNDYLVGYEFDAATGEQEPFDILMESGPIDGVTGSPAFISDSQYTFELLVPRQGSIAHYTKADGTIKGTWTFVETLKPDGGSQVIAVSLVIDIGTFKAAVARMSPSQGSDYLVIYEFPTSGSGWQGPIALVTNDGPIDRVSGSPALTISDGPPVEFELLIPRDSVIYHYTHPVETLEGPWTFVDTLKPPKDDPEIRAIAVSLTLGSYENLETVVRVAPPQDSDYMVSYEFNRITGWQGPFDLISDAGSILAG